MVIPLLALPLSIVFEDYQWTRLAAARVALVLVKPKPAGRIRPELRLQAGKT